MNSPYYLVSFSLSFTFMIYLQLPRVKSTEMSDHGEYESTRSKHICLAFIEGCVCLGGGGRMKHLAQRCCHSPVSRHRVLLPAGCVLHGVHRHLQVCSLANRGSFDSDSAGSFIETAGKFKLRFPFLGAKPLDQEGRECEV